MTIKGVTISEMAKELNLKRHAIEVRLSRAGIKPLTIEALYPPDTLDKIREAPKGRPKKQKAESPGSPKTGVVAPISGYILKYISSNG
jgi:hypothetical protein